MARSPIAPRTLAVLVAASTIVPLGLLLLLGWRQLELDRERDDQLSAERLEVAAGRVLAVLESAIAGAERQLAERAADWPEGAVEIRVDRGRFTARPPNRLAYIPATRDLPEAPQAAFEAADVLEFARRDAAGAERLLKSLARSSDRSVQVTAEFRRARTLAELGRFRDALAVYARLSAADDIAIEGVPISLAARYRRCSLLEQMRELASVRAEAAELADDLARGRWAITAPVYDVYIERAAGWTAGPRKSRPGEVLAAAVEVLRPRWSANSASTELASGRTVLPVGDVPVTVLWRSTSTGFHALLALPAFVEARWLPAVHSIAANEDLRFAVSTSGHAASGAGDSAIRVSTPAAESGLPWAVTVEPVAPGAWANGFAMRRRVFAAGFVLVSFLALVAGYTILRAVSRELAVARMQSDFVSAVSHEFRTPLTALRQFTDILRDSRRIDEEQRGLCYEAQSRATDRLTRLVESLLDFGRMEAGARPYTLELYDCREVVADAVDEFRQHVAPFGYRVTFTCHESARAEMDREALTRALWNLLDNAAKYSPQQREIDVTVRATDEIVSIAVRDKGIGIAPHEQDAIFTRFRRGEEAIRQGIKGTGIGLAMVDHIVKAHTGRVTVHSEVGGGSTFTIVLPRRDMGIEHRGAAQEPVPSKAPIRG